jgi:hypothetical protein
MGGKVLLVVRYLGQSIAAVSGLSGCGVPAHPIKSLNAGRRGKREEERDWRRES